jgi:hypothetical protein
MTPLPREKAFELAHKFRLIDFRTSESTTMMISMADAKKCALIAINEIIKSKPHEWDGCDYYSMEDYWKQVLIEINKL